MLALNVTTTAIGSTLPTAISTEPPIMSTSTISPSPNAPPEKSTSVAQTADVPVEEEESDEVENDNEENDDNVIVEDIIKAHSNPGQAFVPMNREVDEDRDLKELCLLISSKEELVAKLRNRP